MAETLAREHVAVLAPERAKLASRVGCPAQAYVPELRRTCGGHVHAGWFAFYVRGPRAYRLGEVEDVVLHECEGCAGDHRKTKGEAHP